jgi:hypothetical protein
MEYKKVKILETNKTCYQVHGFKRMMILLDCGCRVSVAGRVFRSLTIAFLIYMFIAHGGNISFL